MPEENKIAEMRERLRGMNRIRMEAAKEVGKHVKGITGADVVRIELTNAEKMSVVKATRRWQMTREEQEVAISVEINGVDKVATEKFHKNYAWDDAYRMLQKAILANQRWNRQLREESRIDRVLMRPFCETDRARQIFVDARVRNAAGQVKVLRDKHDGGDNPQGRRDDHDVRAEGDSDREI